MKKKLEETQLLVYKIQGYANNYNAYKEIMKSIMFLKNHTNVTLYLTGKDKENNELGSIKISDIDEKLEILDFLIELANKKIYEMFTKFNPL